MFDMLGTFLVWKTEVVFLLSCALQYGPILMSLLESRLLSPCAALMLSLMLRHVRCVTYYADMVQALSVSLNTDLLINSTQCKECLN